MESISSSCRRMTRGALAGMIGGAVASWAMNEYLAVQPKTAPPDPASRPQGRQSRKSSKQTDTSGDDATVKVAQAISTRILKHDLTPGEKKIAGPAVHYAYGTIVGALYGAVAEVWPLADAGFGILYGIVLWVIGDEAAVPALRLGPPPTQVPVPKHAEYLAAHLVYGIALDLTRRAARLIV